MTLNELLAHNYEVMKRGDWIGFRLVYFFPENGVITDYYEIVSEDYDGKRTYFNHIFTGRLNEGPGSGLFFPSNVPPYWKRQLQWFYEVSVGLR